MIATIRDILWDPDSGRIEYFLQSGEREPPNIAYQVDDLQPAHRLDEPMTWRQRQLSQQNRVR